MLTATPLYAGLIAILLVALSVNVIAYRRAARVSLGDGDDPVLRRRVRAHANCAEYAPLALLLMALAELQGGPAWLIHLLGLMLLIGRALHAVAIVSGSKDLRARVAGMSLTFAVLLSGAAANIVLSLF